MERDPGPAAGDDRTPPTSAAPPSSRRSRILALERRTLQLLGAGLVATVLVALVAAMSYHPPLAPELRDRQLHAAAQAAERAAHALGDNALARIPTGCVNTTTWCTSGTQAYREIHCGSELGFYVPVKLNTQYMMGMYRQGLIGAPVDSHLTHLGEVLGATESVDRYEGSGMMRFHAATVVQHIDGFDIPTEVVHFADGKVAIRAQTGCK